jgi:hypothetical protein
MVRQQTTIMSRLSSVRNGGKVLGSKESPEDSLKILSSEGDLLLGSNSRAFFIDHTDGSEKKGTFSVRWGR